jgi:tetratricopeptide (TPR) repeat protein
MASNVPMVKQIAWVSIILQIVLIFALINAFKFWGFEQHTLIGSSTFLILVFGLRSTIAKDHRKGIRLVKSNKFGEAIPYFEKSVAYFEKNKWVDKYRYLTMLSSTSYSYKEMGLCNIAFCYSQIGNGQQAKAYYEICLSEFPGNGLAITGLNMINSVQNSQGQQP